ncbi:ABC-2 type transport system ATP-binding protein [Hamadaea flava]|uniref:ABC transporter ATP-binding protein n=1 Tax=Hamadaea flava TaxID=1742688 RepID=A0ABV8LN10_9ACTN|nr:ABC transporter ATP-binding protein [Hamadaea flava]MCP2323039.1 ABC-2 type transport system ATP-binding protein [Hamadaea flava]
MILETEALAKRYRRRWALHDCTLAVPEGAIVGLVGPNGAGKSTLLQLIVGLLPPTSGAVRVLGGPPATVMRSGRVGFVAQDAPTYAGLTVADHLNLGAGLNPHRWDAVAAASRIDRLGLPLRQRAGGLSGGQRAQLALTIALSKRPDLLILDEPVAALDPLARRAFLDETAAAATAAGTAVVLSTHLVADLAHVCTQVVVLAGGRVRLASAIAELCGSPAELERIVLDQLTQAAAERTPNS